MSRERCFLRKNLVAKAASLSTVFVVGFLTVMPSPAVASCTWTMFTTPNVGSSGNELLAISAFSTTDALSVGDYMISPTTRHGLVLAYNGVTWKNVPVTTPGISSQFFATTPFSASDAWLAGFYETSPTVKQFLAGTLVSGTFKMLAVPSLGSSERVFGGVLNLGGSPAKAIFVGGYKTSTGVMQNAALMWNGTSFVNLLPPNSSTIGSAFTAIAAVPGTSDVVVSGAKSDSDGDFVPIIDVYHMATGKWTAATGMDPSVNGSEFFNLSPLSSTETWAVGRSLNGTHSFPMIQWFNPSTLSFALQTLPTFTVNAQLFSAANKSATNVLAVGGKGNTTPAMRPLVLRWTGSKWVEQSPSFSIPAEFNSVASVPTTTSKYLAAGAQINGTAPGTLIESGSCP